MNNETDSHRIFFALWPNDDIRQKINDTFMQSPQSKLNGRIMRLSNIHITLHFIGNVNEEKMQCLHQQAGAVKAGSFDLCLDHFGHFYKSRVFWMGCHRLPDNLKQLYKTLAGAFSACDYVPEKRPYAPHITLMRKITRPGEIQPFVPIEWPVKDFVLVESIPVADGVEYRVIHRYPLQPVAP